SARRARRHNSPTSPIGRRRRLQQRYSCRAPPLVTLSIEGFSQVIGIRTAPIAVGRSAPWRKGLPPRRKGLAPRQLQPEGQPLTAVPLALEREVAAHLTSDTLQEILAERDLGARGFDQRREIMRLANLGHVRAHRDENAAVSLLCRYLDGIIGRSRA